MRKKLVKKKKNSSLPKEKLKRTKKKSESSKNIPLASQEERGVAMSPVYEEYEPVDIIFDGGDDGEEGNAPNSEDGMRKDKIKLICGITVVFSLFAAVAVTCYAFAVSYGHISAVPDGESESLNESESEKIVFVKPYDDGSGALTAPEIYETRRESVVTVEASFGGELQGGRSVCTGFVINDNGYIATAAHSVLGAEDIRVTAFDGRKYDARLVEADTESDIALLKVETSGMKSVQMCDADELLAGETVYSIGTPESVDYAGTFFSGLVSYPLRTVTVYSKTGGASKRLKLIQLDGKFNQGSSGSPVFDQYGRVVGMVTMRLSGEYEGVCFAVPAAGAKRVLSAMMNGRALDADILSGVLSFAARLGIAGENDEENGIFGVRVSGFEPESAARGALKEGDVIIRVDNVEVRSERELEAAVGRKDRGESARVTVLRGGQKLTFEVVLG